MNKHEYTKIILMIIRGLFTIIHVEKKENTNCNELFMNFSLFFWTRIYMNKHEYTKILLMIIRGSFTIIHVEIKRKHEWP